MPHVTARLWIRPLALTDCAALAAIMGDMRVMYAWEHTFSIHEVQDWIRRMTGFADPGLGYQALCLLKKDASGRAVPGPLAGQAGLLPRRLQGRDCLELAYILGFDAWHQGLATEAGAFFLEQAFTQRGAEEVFCVIRPMNTASIAVAQRLGMHPCGEHMVHYRGLDMPHVVYGTDREGWKRVSATLCPGVSSFTRAGSR